MTTTEPVDRFLDAVRTATIPHLDIWAPGATLDATVPNWRFKISGPARIRGQLARWYADPGAFEELTRMPLPDGELAEFLLTWTQRGIPHAAHQAHVITLAEGRIVRQTAYCGGRWPAGLLAEMAEVSGG